MGEKTKTPIDTNQLAKLIFDIATGESEGAALKQLKALNGHDITREYFIAHIRAMEKILSDPKKINIQAIAIINKNLQELSDRSYKQYSDV